MFLNTKKLWMFMLRRDRVRISVWIFSLVLISLIIAPAFTELYASEQDLMATVQMMENPAMTAMLGPAYGIDDYHYGAMMSHQMLLFTALAVGIMSIFITVRHTRADEEDGRGEMIRSLPTGRLSILAATLIHVSIVSLMIGLLTGVGLALLGIESIDWMGSLLYGAVLSMTGILFAGLTAFFVQLSEHARGVIGYSMGFLCVAYLLRAVGDISSEALALISPLGLILRTKPYIENHIWPLLILLMMSIIIMIVAFVLSARRDLEAGLIRPKAGKEHASTLTMNLFGLSLRLQKVTLIGWLIGIWVLGLSYGSVFGDIETFIGENELIQQMLPAVEGVALTEQFLTMLMSVIAIVSTIPVLILVLKLRSEEKKGYSEQILASARSKKYIMSTFVVPALIFTFVAQLLSALGLWMASAPMMDEPIGFMNIIKATMAYVPAIWIMIGIASLLIGYLPRKANLIWLYLTYSFIMIYLGDMLQVPEWMKKLSPYGYIPNVPVEPMHFWLIATLIAISLLFIVAGWYGYQTKDRLMGD